MQDYALSIPTGAPITVANDTIEMLSLVVEKKLKIYQIVKRSYTFASFFYKQSKNLKIRPENL